LRSLDKVSRADAIQIEATMMKFSILPVLVLAAMVAHRADAQELSTAADLQSQCAKPGRDQACDAYALGYAEGVTAANKENVTFCVPKGVGGRELRLVMEKYFKDHPERLHERVSVVVGAAFTAAYPCQKPNESK
jgi:hypothetical protein